MLRLYLWCFYFIVVQVIYGVTSQNKTSGCLLPPHPTFGWWSLIEAPSTQLPDLVVPKKSILTVHCKQAYKLVGCGVAVCLDGNWMPPIGQCLKTCPSIHSTSTLKVSCVYKEQEFVNCTQPTEGVLAKFECASFYEDTRLSKPRAICIDGRWSEQIPQCIPVCGRVIIRKRPTLIVRGTNTKKGEFPWQIAIYSVVDKVLLCGGALLSERVVLTAAHCIADDSGNLHSKEQFVVVAGKHYRKFDHQGDQNQSQISEVHDMFVSDRYEGDDQDFEGDIAIIITKVPFKFSTRIQPVCIDWKKKLEPVIFGSGKHKGYVSGWGYTKENSEPANELKSLRVPSIPRKECRKLIPSDYRRYMTSDKFCAGYKQNGTSVCSGDSGGGLVFRKDGRFFIAGVVSLAPLADTRVGGCDSQQYTLYTLVYNYTDNFILRKLSEYKVEETGDHSCTDCTPDTEATTETTTTTTKSTPKRPLHTNHCILPQHPQYGQWSLFGVSHEASPGKLVPPATVIIMSCNPTYKYTESASRMCIHGIWTSPQGRCLKTCPSLNYLRRMNVTCTFNDKIIENCTEPIEDTIARFECDPFYEYSGIPSVCYNGVWSNIPECYPVCGQRPVNTSEGSYPWHVSIYEVSDLDAKSGTSHYPTCAGSLIKTNMVITAAHCLVDSENNVRPVENFVVAAGKYYRSYNHSNDVNAQFSKIKKILVPNHYEGEVDNFSADIAIIVVEKSFKLTNFVQIVCRSWDFKIPMYLNGIAPGWTMQNSEWVPKEYMFEPLSYTDCLEQLPEESKAVLTTDKYCGSPLNASSDCNFEPGTGLVFKHDANYVLRGVVSKRTCNPNETAMFTNNGFFVQDFIYKNEVLYRE